MTEIAYSTCPHDCPSTCSLEVEKIDGQTIGRLSGSEQNTYTAGVICAKVARYAERTHHSERLTKPLKRVGPKGSGEFEEITWEEALDITADAFKKAADKHGAETVWPYNYGGTMGLVQSAAMERLRHEMGYSNMRGTTCSAIVNAGWVAGTGRKIGPDPREMAESDLIIIWGTNAVSTQVNVMTHVARAKKNRGAKVIVVDPYLNPTAKSADQHLCLNPGTDGALACAVMHVAFRDGYADQEYMAKFADVPDELEEHLKTRTPEWAAEITGLDVQEIENFAESYCKTERAYIRLGYGLSRCRNGAVNVHAVSSLATVTGKWPTKGAGTYFSSSDLYHFDTSVIEAPELKKNGIRTIDHPRIGAALTGDKSDLAGGAPITAMIVQGTNPMSIAPDQNKVHKGLSREDLFLCVHEQFMTETAMMADIVLPCTTFLEHDDIYKAGGHTYIGLGPKIIDPVGESKPNDYVINELAKRLGATHRAFTMTTNEVIDETLRLSGYPDLENMTENHWHDCEEGFDGHHFMDGFGWLDGKFRFKPDWKAIGERGDELPALPDHWDATDPRDDDHPFKLVTPPARNFLNSSFNNTPSSLKREREPSLMIHPDDAAMRNIKNGDLVIIGNNQGELKIKAEIFDGINPGVLIVEGLWANSKHNGGKGINVLTHSEIAAPAGGAVYHDSAVWVRKSP
ncbi:molybdopterin-containing oxidoreductase family protein [Pseudemcibacter aquimaris]|uniref:molybdopterin-containing oxidoreductase family protein n=1 Tax=Pseudemcibacter aquimaris TaxID=2857064 RepID=UPI002012DD5D|nr:molybdopterin oxidoreductase family protein [Pseudemcibacter aquimaris]MCC3861324.1 molybdopterin oxidoreductase family protein [Pseudemcibacter aquimaris]WDU58096.1 molybdopterin oxidoreductase family protein [Pseudemcibacter aquimaris]